MKLTLNEFFIYLIQTKGFYGRLASSLQRIARPGMGTMAVGIRDGRAALFYDPDFVRKLDVHTAMWVLEHELLHLILDHIPRYLELLSIQPDEVHRKKAAAVYNIAMDCAINTLDAMRSHPGFAGVEKLLQDSILEKNPDHKPDERDGMCLPEKFDLPKEGSFEMYQYQLMKKVEIVEIAIRLHGGNTHELWGSPDEGDGDGEGKGDGGEGQKMGSGAGGEGNPTQGQGKGGGKGKGGKGDNKIVFEGVGAPGMTSEELMSQAHRIREQIKNTLRETARSMGGIGRGTLPSQIEEWLEDYLRDAIIPWWEVLTTYARMSRAAKYQRSCTVPNRTLMALSEEDNRIIPMPGRVRDKSWRVFMMVDTSGSMSTESLEIAKSELQHLLNVDDAMEVRYMEGDAAVHTDVLLKKGDEIPREVVGRGGTDFDAYFAYMKKYVDEDDKAPDLVIVYTDGYAPAVSMEHRLPPEVPIVWLVTPQHSSSFAEGYGTVIVCDPDHNDRYKKAAA